MNMRDNPEIPRTSAEPPPADGPRVGVVVPACNEAATVGAFSRRLLEVLDGLDTPFEVLFVDDGSSDDTAPRIEALQDADPRIGLLRLSRNFGKEVALSAGLDHVRGEAVVIMDADLQDPPELIPQLLARWEAGYDVVYAVRTARDGDPWLKRVTAHAFYRLMRRLGSVPIPPDTGDFRVLSRRAVEAVRRFREQHRFMKGLFTWVGYRQAGVPYERKPRAAGESKWGYWRLWNFALEGITSFTTLPLRIATYVGFATALLAFAYGVVVVLKTLLYGDPVAGYPSLMTVVLFLGGVQLMAIGVIGEYLGRMFDETKARPLYFVERYRPARAAGEGAATVGLARNDRSAG